MGGVGRVVVFGVGAGGVGAGFPAVGRVVGFGGTVLGAGCGTVKSGGGTAEVGDQAGWESASAAADCAEAARRTDAAPSRASGSTPTLGLGTQLRGRGLQALPETGAVGREPMLSTGSAGRAPKKSEGRGIDEPGVWGLPGSAASGARAAPGPPGRASAPLPARPVPLPARPVPGVPAREVSEPSGAEDLRGASVSAVPHGRYVGEPLPGREAPGTPGVREVGDAGGCGRGGASGKRADAGGGGGALAGSVRKGEGKRDAGSEAPWAGVEVPRPGASGEVFPSWPADGAYGRTQGAGILGDLGVVAPVGRAGRVRGAVFRAPAAPAVPSVPGVTSLRFTPPPAPLTSPAPFTPYVPFSSAPDGLPVSFAGFSPSASLCWSSPLSPAVGGWGGRGGTSGRGGIEARRASVLMHPPFPLARAVVLVRGPSCACPGGPCGHGRPFRHAYPREGSGIPARISGRSRPPCVRVTLRLVAERTGTSPGPVGHLPGTSPYPAVIESGRLRS